MTAILKEEPAEEGLGGECLLSLPGPIRRCLEKRPQARFQSASDLAYNLRSLSSVPAASAEGAARRSGVGWHKVALGLAVVAVVVVALIWLNPGNGGRG